MNPLRIDDKPGSDTRYMVRSVLAFMADALAALESTNDCLSGDALVGVVQIMSVCRDALREPEGEGGLDG